LRHTLGDQRLADGGFNPAVYDWAEHDVLII
jgi:hypothetical protein